MRLCWLEAPCALLGPTTRQQAVIICGRARRPAASMHALAVVRDQLGLDLHLGQLAALDGAAPPRVDEPGACASELLFVHDIARLECGAEHGEVVLGALEGGAELSHTVL